MPCDAQFLGACTKQEPYVLITELMSGGSMADCFRMIQARRSAACFSEYLACALW